MSGLRISELTELVVTEGADLLVIVDTSEPDINTRTKHVKIENLIPTPLAITSFVVAPSIASLGQMVTSATFTFAANKPLTSLSINSGVGPVSSSPYVATVNVTNNITYTLTII